MGDFKQEVAGWLSLHPDWLMTSSSTSLSLQSQSVTELRGVEDYTHRQSCESQQSGTSVDEGVSRYVHS